MKQLVDKFHKMETEYSLFELGDNLDIPVWDIIRYHVYVKYYFSLKARENLKIKPVFNLSYYFNLLKKTIYQLKVILFNKGEIIFFTSSRYKNQEGFYFDKSAKPLIEKVKHKSFAIESTFNNNISYTNTYNLSFVVSKLLGKNIYDKNALECYYNQINKVIIETFGENLFSFDEMCAIVRKFYVEYYYFKFIFKIKRTKQIFIATGNPKAQIKVAKEQDIKTFLIQHAGIEFDEIDYSYPNFINPDSNILYPETLLTLGNYWGKQINIPVKEKLVIGSDYFNHKPNIPTDDTILIISTIVHSTELKKFTQNLASSRKDLKIVYKLHPNEFHLIDSYINLFKNYKNVSVLSTELDTNILIAKCQLVILIVSATLYEALNQNKKVAVFKRINYKRQKKLAHLSNLYFFDETSEVNEILTKKTIETTVDFYIPLDMNLVNHIFAEK